MEKRQNVETTDQVITQKTNKVILILGIKLGDKLKMSDGGKTEGNSGDILFWVLAPDSEVKEITGFEPKSGFPDLLRDLGPVGNSPNVWKGTLIDVTRPATEQYTIYYIKDNGSPAQYDPVIQVNPAPPLTQSNP